MATSTAVGTVTFNLQITNAGFSTLNLSDVTVRYWFTNDGNALSGITFVSYYSSNGTDITKDVHGTFVPAAPGNVTATSDSYLELSFGTTTGTIAAFGGGGANIQVAFHGPGSMYSYMFNETNDYSFDPTKKAPMYAPWKAITAYTKGALVWGCEPGAGGSGSDAGVPAVDAGQPPVEAGQMPDASDAGSGG